MDFSETPLLIKFSLSNYNISKHQEIHILPYLIRNQIISDHTIPSTFYQRFQEGPLIPLWLPYFLPLFYPVINDITKFKVISKGMFQNEKVKKKLNYLMGSDGLIFHSIVGTLEKMNNKPSNQNRDRNYFSTSLSRSSVNEKSVLEYNNSKSISVLHCSVLVKTVDFSLFCKT